VGGHQGRGYARDLGSQHFGGTQPSKTGGQFFAAAIHQRRVDLVIDKPVDFQNAVAEVPAVPADTID
jgi:hypothetical protein